MEILIFSFPSFLNLLSVPMLKVKNSKVPIFGSRGSSEPNIFVVGSRSRPLSSRVGALGSSTNHGCPFHFFGSLVKFGF